MENDIYKTTHSISTTWSMNEFHFHEDYEILLSLTEGNRFFINDRIVDVKKGDLFLFNSHDIHKNVVPKDMKYERYLLFFNPSLIRSLPLQFHKLLALFDDRPKHFQNRIPLAPEAIQHLISLFNKSIHLQMHKNAEVYGLEIKKINILTEILLTINSYYFNYYDLVPSDDLDLNKKITPIIDYINAHIADKILLDDLAQTFFINKYYLCEIFKKNTGFTINEYISRIRISKSRELLLKGYPVNTVSTMVGYPNHSHFIKTFKKYVGQTPKQYALKNIINP